MRLDRAIERSATHNAVESPRSDLLRRVLGCLRDHPHDDTSAAVTARLGFVERDSVLAALHVLEHEALARHAGEHWQLTRHGWSVAHDLEPFPNVD